MVGVSLLAGATLINIPYMLLVTCFDYPDVLRLPAAQVLTRFEAGGAGLIWTWLAFAWVGAPLLYAVPNLPRAIFSRPHSGLLRAATMIGSAGLVVQIAGLLRWVFVVPVLARVYTAPESSEATRQSATLLFEVVHSYGGVLLGEHMGYMFSCVWMALISAYGLGTGELPRWMGALGLSAALIYSMAHAELLATVMPQVPVWGPAGLVGSLLWLLWMACMGVLCLMRPAPPMRACAPSTR
jgi:hypothetical protein